MKGNNAKFKADPVRFLENSGIVCPTMVRDSKVGAFQGIQGHAVMEFDLVPMGRFVELTVLGAVGSYARTWRFGSPIVGHFLHWNGQTASAGPSSFGSIDLSSCTADYIFTAPFTGCHFVVARHSGLLRVYHEPTQDGVQVDYGGGFVTRVGPDYSADEPISGNGVIVRRPGGWTAIVSTMVSGEESATVKCVDF